MADELNKQPQEGADQYDGSQIQVLEGLEPEITDTLPAKFYCNCSKERIEKAIISIGKKDIQSMIDDGEDIEEKCHFCNTSYNYTVDDLNGHLK